jgi:hypothetical protein
MNILNINGMRDFDPENLNLPISLTKGSLGVPSFELLLKSSDGIVFTPRDCEVMLQHPEVKEQVAIAILNLIKKHNELLDETDPEYDRLIQYLLNPDDPKLLNHELAIYGKKMIGSGFAHSKVQVQRFLKQYKDFQGLSKLRMYKAVPEKIWKLAPSEMFNDKFVDSRIEVNLF